MDSDDFKAQQQKIHAALVAVNRTVNGIAAEDLTFLRTVNPGVAAELDDQAARLLRLSNGLLKSAAGATGKRAPPQLEDADDVDLNWRGVVDVIDALLEKADTTLDEYTGLLKRKDAPTTEGGPDSKKAKQQGPGGAGSNPASGNGERLDWNMRRANIAKPQELFERKTDNFDKGPWKPLLTTKPHAIVPLEDSLTTFVDENNLTQFKHPYEAEINQLAYPDAVYRKREPIPYLPTENTSAVWVDTFEGVEAMLAELREADEIAVDLEHHDYRTYTGLLSLMQISTRSKDWIIDTLQPWRHRLEILNEVFADPTKLKVFHGASSDIVWLQRDLGLYIVGLFDTYFACDCLEYSKRSLAFLLERFVNFEADKKYQMADWRIRPLPEEMLYYARSDTHYLLYIYDMVRNELAEKSDRSNAEKDLTEYVLQKSKEVSLSRHEALLCDPETGMGVRGWLNNLVKTYTLLSGEQFAVYRALYQWRDDLARRLDESPGFLMPVRVLSDIARILPPDRKALWSLLNNTARATKSHMDELFTLIQDAQARGATGPTSVEFLRSDAVGALVKSNRQLNFSAHATATAAALPGPSKDAAPLPDVTDLRSTFSQLWGKTPIGGKRGADGEEANGGVPIEAPWFVQAAIGPVSSSAAAPAAPAAPAANSAGTKKVLPSEDYIEFNSPVPKPVPSREVEMTTPTAAAASAPPPAAEEKKKTNEDEEEEGGEDEAFTLKWGKKGGKAGAAALQNSENALTDAQKQRKQSKKERKEARRAAKRSKAPGSTTGSTGGEEGGATTQTSDSDGGGALIPNEEDDDDNEEEEDKVENDAGFVPFNYDTAGSVLHPKKAAGAGADNKAPHKGKKVFNPYGSKGDEGPKAARRMHFEKVGKTGTFKK
ncbi:exosome nuclease subunit [Sporothrix bragantina]|uniref:Exosome nuclease subunit n=1 Tax=Sporothrix bragantina TaxID=671064 RepID=A0ABP0CVQ0_9PEZI